MNEKYQKLFEPISIGDVVLKNRFVMAPMELGMGGEGGTVSKRIIKFYQERAENDVSLIITGSVGISLDGRGQPKLLSCYDDKFIPGFRDLARTLHKEGCKLGAQIYHAGRQTTEGITGIQPISPSAIPCPLLKNNPREMNAEDFKTVLGNFISGSKRLEQAELDIIEVHLAHGYLLHSFLSPFSNKRTDQYGGSLENRMRFPREVIKAIIEAVNIPVTVRISVEEFIDDGLHIEEAEEICHILERDGVKAISITAGSYGSLPTIIQPMLVKQGFLVPFAERIKAKTTIPIMVAGRLNEPKLINDVITSGKSDLVALGRTLIADQSFVKKIANDNPEPIKRCIACNQGCIDQVNEGKHVTCTVNPRTGFELEINVEKTKKKKKVMIVGAGPAGLYAAKTCAERGHEVILVEKKSQLGGKFILASILDGKEEIEIMANDFISQVTHLKNITIITEQEANTDFVKAQSPDALILSVGARQASLKIEGATSDKSFLAEDVILDPIFFKKKVVVVGGGLVGVDTALELCKRGVDVQLVEILPEIASEASPTVQPLLKKEIEDKAIKVYTNCKIMQMTEQYVSVEHNGNSIELEADTIVQAVGYLGENEVVKALNDLVSETYVIGDAVKARNFFEAITEGFKAGLKI
jgi:2,4-dienoyl-CoA reductase-like NADH-dependent reductase (Old Yellow Enzyme family)/thioredoxin reductase